MRIYLASSWRNPHQPAVLSALRAAGHEVYDFRNPAPGNEGFSWADIEPTWQSWDAARFREALRHPIANEGFDCDWGGACNGRTPASCCCRPAARLTLSLGISSAPESRS